MKYGSVPGIEKSISLLVQGTTMIGSGDLDYSFALLDQVFELGCNTFDTAHVYGGGDNERTVGRWVRERGIRDQVVIIGKGAHPYGRNRVTPEDIASDIADSLERFGFEYMDLYLLHRDDPEVPVGPIVESLNEHQRAGRIGAFGGSNWTHQRIQEANEYARTRGLTPFAASSPHFSLAVQLTAPWEGCISITGPEQQAARDWYRETRMPLFSWSSVALGFFSGRISRENLEAAKEGPDALCVRCYASEENFQRLDRARQLGERKGLSASQVALAWVLNQPMNIFPLVGSRSVEEFKENLAVLDLALTPEEMAWLNLETDSQENSQNLG